MPVLARLALVLLLVAPAPSCHRPPPYQEELMLGASTLRSEPAKARAHFQRASELGAKLQGGMGIGLAEEALGHLDEARKQFREVKQLAPKDTRVRLALARVELARSELGAARAELESVVAEYPNEHPALLLLSVLALTPEQARHVLGLWDKAEKAKGNVPQQRAAEVVVARAELGHRLGRDSRSELDRVATGAVALGSPEMATSLAQGLLQVGSLDAARAMLKAVSLRSPGDRRAWLDLLRIEVSLGKFEAASRTLGQIPAEVRRTPDCLEVQARLASARSEHGEASRLLKLAFDGTPTTDRRRRAALLYSRAQASILEGKDSLAREVLAKSVELDPDSVPAQLALAAMRVRTGQWTEAEGGLRSLLAKHPGETKGHELLISALLFAKNPTAARAACARYGAMAAKTASAHAFIAAALANLGDTEAGRAEYLEALKLEPENMDALRGMTELEVKRVGLRRTADWLEQQGKRGGWQALNVLGDLWSAHKQTAPAEKAYRESTTRDPRASEPWASLGRLFASKGDREQAIEAMQKAVSLDESPPMPLLERLAQLQRDGAHHADARVTYEQILRRNPESLPALNNLAMLLAGPLGAPGDAVTLAERAYSKASKSPAVADTLGWALVRRGKREDAGRALQLLTSAAAQLKAPDVYYHLAKAHALAGNLLEARRTAEQALALSSKFDGAEHARAMLASSAAEPPSH